MALATGTKLGSYEITSAIGAGGMGEVYQAHDTKLGRDVAIKVLPEAFAHDPERLARFQREAKMLAALNHPNIATIYGLEFSNGTHFLIMELVSGETLAERIKREGAVPIKEALKIAVQIAQALETANDKGIIHRDLKPANVKVTPEGNLKVLDFGLAKAFAGDNGLDLSNAPTLTAIGTEEGKLVGTPAYMSPEQARGQAVDKRTDIWAFGCLLYELLTARRAFRGETLTNTIAAILEREPDWQDLPRSTPTQIRDLLRRCLQKDRQRRMRDIGDVRVEIEEASFALVRGQQSVARTFHIPRGGTLAWGVLLVLVIATSVAVWNRKSSSPIFTRRGLKPIESLAVLPLEELSGDPEQDYFADGMTDELITDLAQIKALRVISRTSVMVYKGAHKSLPDIARELNVDAVLEGTVLRSGTRVRITAQLIYAPTDRHLWAESYEREVRDVLGLQREVAKAVVEEIRVNVTPEENMRLLGAPPVNSEAYEAYLRGRYLWNKRTPDDLKDAIVKFKRAIDLDPTYALAWAGLADGYSLLSDYDEEPPREAMPLARAAANKALDLDDSLGEPHATLATIEWTHDWNAAAAEIDFKRAIALRPNYASAHQWYGMYLCNRGRFDDGIVELRRAQELDPLSMVIEANVGRCHYYARRYNEASELLGPLARREPDYWIVHAILGQTYLAMGKLDDAIHELERARALLPDSSRNLGVLGDAYGRAGRRADALKLARELAGLSQERYVPPVYRAMIDIGLGERSQAIAFLERAYTDRSNWMVLLENEPEFDSLRSDPRFGALLYRIAHAPEQAVQPLGSGPRVADGADRRASLLDIPGEQE
jgi:serine/threonine protein kinase/tetratricopeptide (TPR) repeat protein